MKYRKEVEQVLMHLVVYVLDWSVWLSFSFVVKLECLAGVECLVQVVLLSGFSQEDE